LENALRPVEKYALRFREEIEPVWTKEASEAWRRQMLENANQREWDLEELQRRKEQMEREMDESQDLVLVREICIYCTCWLYSLCNFQYRQHYENSCSYNFEC